MKKLLICLLTVLSNGLLHGYLASDKALWYGSIMFPATMQVIPPIRVYYAGNKLSLQVDHDAKQSIFSLTEYKQRTSFTLLICTEIEVVMSTANTVDYLRVPDNVPYKLYELSYNAAEGVWSIVQIELAENRQIPDNAIIVRYHPLFIKKIEGGTAYELPKIILDERTLDNLSPEELHDASIHLFLSSLNSDSIHAKSTSLVRSDISKKTVSLLIT
jgi:hypothetical protein